MNIDRISLIYPDVSDEEFTYFKGMLEDSVKVIKRDAPEWTGKLIDNYWIGKRKKDYHYNMTLGSEEEGRITVNWKHNSEPNNSKETYDMRVEFNPAKNDTRDIEKYVIFDLLKQMAYYRKGEGWERRDIVCTMMDVAYDFEKDKSALKVVGKRRRPDYYKDTIYFGKRSSDGYLKVYNKKKELERKGVKVDSEYLTRIEYKWKARTKREGVPLWKLGQLDLKINERYEIYQRGELGEIKAEHRACLWAYEQGLIELHEFTRTTQKHIKKILSEAWERIDLEKMYRLEIENEVKKLYELLY